MSAGTAAASAPRLPIVHGAVGGNQDRTRPSFPGAMYSLAPPKAIEGSFTLAETALAGMGARLRPRHRADRLSAARTEGNGISRQAPATATLSAAATITRLLEAAC